MLYGVNLTEHAVPSSDKVSDDADVMDDAPSVVMLFDAYELTLLDTL